MIDLAVDQQDRLDAGVAHAFARLYRRECMELRQNVGGCVEQQPISVIGADCDRRLSTGLAVHFVAANTMAIVAVAIPLRKTAAGCRAENSDFHGIVSND